MDCFRLMSLSYKGWKVPIRQIPSLLLTSQLQNDWLKFTIPGEAGTEVLLGFKSWFADVRLSTSDSILGLLLLF